MTTSVQDDAVRPLSDFQPLRGVRRKITVEQFDRMIASGEVAEGEPWELLDGQIIFKDRSATGEDPMSVGDAHALITAILIEVAARFQGRGVHVRVQDPVVLPPYNKPQPDAAIVLGSPRELFARSGQPRSKDILCLIEVADSSLRLDSTVKLREYADTGVMMYVILSILHRTARVLREPVVGEGRYASDETLAEGAVLPLPTADETTVDVRVADLLPPGS